MILLIHNILDMHLLVNDRIVRECVTIFKFSQVVVILLIIYFFFFLKIVIASINLCSGLILLTTSDLILLPLFY